MMKKITMTLVLAAVLGTGAFAETNPDMGYLGVGWVSALNNDIDFQDNTKVNFFFGWGNQVLAPLPIWVGFEGLFGIQKIGEDSSVSYVYRDMLISDGYGDFVYYASIDETMLKTTFWDVDISPRLMATLDLDPLPVYATVYTGLNFNRLTMDWEYTDSGAPETNSSGSETLQTFPVQVVTGLRVNAYIMFLEFTRFFDLGEGDVKWETVAKNRLSLGLALKF